MMESSYFLYVQYSDENCTGSGFTVDGGICLTYVAEKPKF